MHFDLQEGGWIGDFAYNPDEEVVEAFYEFTSSHQKLPHLQVLIKVLFTIQQQS
ncbi:MAG: hypothetical protein RIF33_05075 [Cyclobacteriaceae bacterium]